MCSQQMALEELHEKKSFEKKMSPDLYYMPYTKPNPLSWYKGQNYETCRRKHSKKYEQFYIGQRIHRTQKQKNHKRKNWWPEFNRN